MDFLLRQLLLLLQPIGLVWAALLVLTIVLWRKKSRRCAATSFVLAALLTLCGSTDFPGWLLRGLEAPWAGFKPAEMPACDAVVVCGGGGEPSRHEVGGVHFTKAGDRIIMGLELMRLGKAPVLVLGGGEADFSGEKIAEADVVMKWSANFAMRAGTEILSLGPCAHTRDEAEKVAKLVGERRWKRITLVTSASHMTRALAVFRTLGIEATPAPCNFLTTVSTAPAPFSLSIPSWQGCEKIAIWAHEKVGWAIYQQRGWVK